MFLLFSLALAGEIDGAEVYRANCTRCHYARPPSELDADRWPAVAFQMRTRAGLTRAETDALLAFLVPPPAPTPVAPRLLANPVLAEQCVRCHDPARIDAAVASGRTAEGWEATFTRMRSYGATITPERGEALSQWLSAEAGK